LKEEIMTARLALMLIVSTLALAACGTSEKDRAISGGVIGAGVGGVAGALGGNALGGALLGGAAGAATGALTAPK
jgi:osmotically inducible lipoprotein OsmB